jgi:hypothetical protein
MAEGVPGIGIVNHLRGDCIWFHTTPTERLDSILRDGLKCNSPPAWQSRPEPWIYVSTKPWQCGEHEQVVLAVDLSDVPWDKAGWPFVDYGGEEWENRWQLRVFVDIPPGKIRSYTP